MIERGSSEVDPRFIFFDSFAMLAFLRKEAGYDIVSDLLTEIATGEKLGSMCIVNVGEVYYITARKQNQCSAQKALEALTQFPIDYVEANYALTFAAAKLKAKYIMSFADAFAAALTIEKKGTLITGDPEFKQLIGETNFRVKFM